MINKFSVSGQVTHTGKLAPIAALPEEQQVERDLFAFTVNDEVNKRMVAHELFRAVGHLRAAEDNADVRMFRPQPPGNFRRDANVPDVSAEQNQIRPGKLIDSRLHAHALKNRQQEFEGVRRGMVGLRVSLREIRIREGRYDWPEKLLLICTRPIFNGGNSADVESFAISKFQRETIALTLFKANIKTAHTTGKT